MNIKCVSLVLIILTSLRDHFLEDAFLIRHCHFQSISKLLRLGLRPVPLTAWLNFTVRLSLH